MTLSIRDLATRRVAVILVVVALALAAGGGLYLFLRWRTDRNRTRDFKAALTEGWGGVSDKADEMLVVMTRIDTAADLEKLAGAAVAMRDEIGRFARSVSDMKVPGSMGDIEAANNKALESLDLYLETVSRLASGRDQEQIESGMPVLDSRAIRASEDTGDFLIRAPFAGVTIPGDFYEAGNVLESVFLNSGDQADEQERIAASDAVRRFMTADLVEKNFDVISSMISAYRKLFMEAFQITPEQLPGIWAEGWGQDKPVEFYVSSAGTSFTDADHATVKAVVYYASKENPPRTAKIRVIRENGEWKIDSYPFVGWL